MKNLLVLSIFIFLSFSTVLAQKPAGVNVESGHWINVAPPNAGFVVLMPGKPSEATQPVEGHPGMENHLLTLETEVGGYLVSYLEFTEETTDPEEIKRLLDRGREGGVAKSGGELVSETEIKLGSHFGREWILKLPRGMSATARAYWVKRRLYQTVFVKNPKETDSQEIRKLRQQAEAKFLGSFSLRDDVSN